MLKPESGAVHIDENEDSSVGREDSGDTKQNKKLTEARKKSLRAKSRMTAPPNFSMKEDGVPPVPDEGLPEGWTMAQWKYYGADYLKMNAGGTAHL